MSPAAAAAATTAAAAGSGGGAAASAACEKAKEEYQRCLSASGRRSWKCQEEEKRLRLCESTLGVSFCIDETKDLIDCCRNPDKSGCAKQFVAMRECNRPEGPRVVEQNGKYVVPSPPSSNATEAGRGVELCDAFPPQRAERHVAAETERLAKELATRGVAADANGAVYSWESLRSRPGH